MLSEQFCRFASNTSLSSCVKYASECSDHNTQPHDSITQNFSSLPEFKSPIVIWAEYRAPTWAGK